MSAPQPMGVLAVAAARVHAVWASPVIAGLDLATIALGLWGAFHVWRGHLARARAFLFACVAMGWAGVLGLAGSQDAWRSGGLGGASGAASHASGGQAPLLAAGFAIYAVACGLGGFHVLRLIGRGPALRAAAESL